MAESSDPESQVRVIDRRWWARREADASSDEVVGRKPTYVEELERQLADQANQLQNLIAEHRRALDEFEKAKIRIRRDVGREVDRGKRAVIGEFLEVVDNLDRAVAASREGAVSPESLRQGIAMVQQQFLAKLQVLQVTKVAALGERFDASRHEAVTTLGVSNPADDGVILNVLKEGYAIGEDLLRPASVVVGKFDG